MKSKTLFVGDMHVQIKNLEDSSRIFDFIYSVASRDECDSIIFLGDIYHTHAVLRQEVIELIQSKMKILSTLNKPIYVIAGNHDGYSPIDVSVNAVRQTLSHIVNVVDDKSGLVFKKYLLMPFTADEQEFAKNISKQEYLDKTLVCHQTFNGAEYENGFYAPHGFNTKSVPQKYVISGDIHKSQSFDKIFYTGSVNTTSSSDVYPLEKFFSGSTNKAIYLHDSEVNTFKVFAIDDLIKTYFNMVIEETSDLDKYLREIMAWSEETSKSSSIISIEVIGSKDAYDNVQNFVSSLNLNKTKIKLSHNDKDKKNISEYNLDSEKSDIKELFKNYVFTTIGENDYLKEKVWKTVQRLEKTPN